MDLLRSIWNTPPHHLFSSQKWLRKRICFFCFFLFFSGGWGKLRQLHPNPSKAEEKRKKLHSKSRKQFQSNPICRLYFLTPFPSSLFLLLSSSPARLLLSFSRRGKKEQTQLTRATKVRYDTIVGVIGVVPY